MEYKKVKKALLEIGYKHDSMKSIMCGRAIPSMSKAIKLEDEYDIPLHTWRDIKKFVSKQNTTSSKTSVT